MPHAVAVEQSTESARTPKIRPSSSRELRQLHRTYNETRDQYLGSSLLPSITRLLESKGRPAVTKIVSLGLGSLKSANQPRIMKQLVILLAIAEHLRQHQPQIEIYAQDPSFTRSDEAFLQSLGVHILSTPSATEAGEAEQHIDESTLVYCPFLTLEAYQIFFPIPALKFCIGDDFDALRIKWPKHSAGYTEAEAISRRVVQRFQKRVIGGDGFWDAGDKPFPMAMYLSVSQRHGSKQPKAKL